MYDDVCVCVCVGETKIVCVRERVNPSFFPGIYVHSGLAGDEGIVYDNTSPYRHSTKDLFISITRGTKDY